MSTMYGGFGPGSTASRSGGAPSTGEDFEYPGVQEAVGANVKPPIGCAPDLLRLWQQRQGQAPQVPAWVERLLKVRTASCLVPNAFLAHNHTLAPAQQGQTVREDLARQLTTELEWSRLEAEVQRIRTQWAANLTRPQPGGGLGGHPLWSGSLFGGKPQQQQQQQQQQQERVYRGPNSQSAPSNQPPGGSGQHWDGVPYGGADTRQGASPSPVPSSAGGLPRYRPVSRVGSHGGMTTASAFFPRNKQKQQGHAPARGGGRGAAASAGQAAPWNSPAGLVEALLRFLQQLRAALSAALGTLADSKASGEVIERVAVLISRHAHVLFALLGVLFCLYLKRAGYVAPGWGRGRLAGGGAGGGSPSALDALHVFAMDSRHAMKDILRGARDSVVTLALAPVSATRLAVASVRATAGKRAGSPVPGDPAARAAIQRARAQRSAAYAAAKCGTEQEDEKACAKLLDVAPDMGLLAGDADVDLETAWTASACGTPRADAPVCAALASLRAAGRAAQEQVATAVPPASGDVSSACTLALAASEARTAELVTVQASVESRVKRLALVRAHCRGPALADTVDCAVKMADAEAAASEDTARLEALTVRAEAASQRAYTLCMAARERGNSATAAAAGLVDWLASEADALLAHAAALEEQRGAAAARAAVEAAKQGGAATPAGAAWAALAKELEEEIAATTRVAASTRQEADAASSTAGRLFGRVYPPSSTASASWRSMWVSSVTADQMTMAYTMAAMAAPLTALAMFSAAAAERLRLLLISRRLRRGSGSDTALDAAGGQQAGLASDTWVALTGDARVGGVLLADVSPPPQLQARLSASELEGVEYEFVWTRSFRGVFEVVDAQHAPWYTLSRDDLGSRLAVTVCSVLPSGEYGPTASARTRTVKA